MPKKSRVHKTEKQAVEKPTIELSEADMDKARGGLTVQNSQANGFEDSPTGRRLSDGVTWHF